MIVRSNLRQSTRENVNYPKQSQMVGRQITKICRSPVFLEDQPPKGANMCVCGICGQPRKEVIVQITSLDPATGPDGPTELRCVNPECIASQAVRSGSVNN
ncbi:MAG: hypothetical protein UV78_C0074G0010 [Parcubacteria group bacterium GW2011_GWA2_43_17]|nr:MAG: hypothetical protein UV78_C0074G0010 [Parcubacteria group bacterium GW2011_GWA2_43_17]KKT90980.1 MAG: hypothetical protein UW91_C0041G0001 [Parcubacteria group bacterium GW2011_GWF2_45_11]KKT96668.1 MAG: hypothetical protein UW98_C0037G0001 [Parcubacteria group bacterium GW2011_GWC2_45_15]